MLKHVARSAYELYRIAWSNVSGLYSDNIDLLSGTVGPLAATGVTGLGLVAEVVADALDWASRSTQQARILTTLRTIAGRTPGVAYPRSPQGFHVHFLGRDTGKATSMESCMVCLCTMNR